MAATTIPPLFGASRTDAAAVTSNRSAAIASSAYALAATVWKLDAEAVESRAGSPG